MREPCLGHVGGYAFGIQTRAGFFNGLIIDICSKDLYLMPLFQAVRVFLEQDGERIGFFSCRTGRHPDPYRAARLLSLKQVRNDLLIEGHKGLGVTEKIGDADQEIPEECLHFHRICLQIACIVFYVIYLADGHAPLDAAKDRVFFVLGEVVPRIAAQYDKYLLKGVGNRGYEIGNRQLVPVESVLRKRDQLLRHLVGRQDIVNKAGGNGATGHTIIGCRLGALDHGHSTFALD